MPTKECFSIDDKKLQFDAKIFYESVFADVNEHIEIKINDICKYSEGVDASIIKNSKHIYDTINNLTCEICEKLNTECFCIK